MTAVRALWGPGTLGYPYMSQSSLPNSNMNDADNATGWVFSVPWDGSITDVGFLVSAKVGTPPAYNVGIVTLDSSGKPTTTVYGGSAITAYTPSGTAPYWVWVTLDTAATANAGDYAAAHVYPSGTAPDGSNYMSIPYRGVTFSLGNGVYYTSLWQTGQGGSPMAIRYNTGAIYGVPLASAAIHASARSNTTPDEIGCKFTLPAAMTCYGAQITMQWGTSATLDVVLYDGSNSVLASTSISDKDYQPNVTLDVTWDAVNLSAATTYRLILKPTVASSGDIYTPKWTIAGATERAALPHGDLWHWTERTDAGAWTDTTTAIAPMSLWVSDITFSTTSGGGGEFAYIG